MALKTLADIKKRVESRQTPQGDGESPFLTLKDGNSFKIRPLQEFEDSNDLYDERRGTVKVVDEHTSPKDFKIRAVCTADDEGRCWACEQQSLPEIGKKWKPRTRFYTNVIVRNEDGPDKVKILAQGFSDRNVGNDLIEYATEYGNLSGREYKISRSGAGMNDTSYSMIPLAEKPLSDEDQALEVIDLDKFIKYVPYDQQSAFYSGEKKDDGGSSDDW